MRTPAGADARQAFCLFNHRSEVIGALTSVRRIQIKLMMHCVQSFCFFTFISRLRSKMADIIFNLCMC